MKTIVSAIVGGLVFLAFAALIQTSFIISIIVGVLALIATSLILSSSKSILSTDEMDKSKYEFDMMIRENKDKVSFLRNHYLKIEDKIVKNEAIEIYKSAKWIIDNLEKHPEDLNSTKKFINYYLDTALNIIEKYIEFEKGLNFSDDQKQSLEKSKSMISLLNKSFKHQINKVVDNDILELKVEMEVLEKTLRAEGISNE